MRSSAPGSFSRGLRNPTLLAMLGSAAFHGMLVLISALKPAESQPNRLQIVSLAPRGTARQFNASGAPTLSVPSELPPIGLGNVPQFSELPSTTTFTTPSQSFFTGSRQSSIDLNKIRTADVPQRSFPDVKIPDYSASSVSPGDFFPLQPPTSAKFPTVKPGGNFPISRIDPNPTQFDPSQNSGLPGLAANSAGTGIEPFPQSPFGPGSTESMVPPSGTESGGSSSIIGADSSSLEAKARLKPWLQAQSLLSFQNLSVQRGPRLAADYPAEACTDKKTGTALIAAVFGPDGKVASRNDSVEILESTGSEVLDEAARAAVAKYSPPPAKGSQALNFTVDVPYSEAVCQALKTQSSPSPQPGDKPAGKSSTQPSAVPTPRASSTTKPSRGSKSPTANPTLKGVPGSKTAPGQLPPEATDSPKTTPVPSIVPETPRPSSSSPTLEPSTMTNPSPSAAPSSAASSLEPLPSPEISTPQETLKP